MRDIDFCLLDKSGRLTEFKKTNDTDIIVFTLQRATGLDSESLKDLSISYSLIRHKLTFKDKPEILIKILDDLMKIKLDPLMKSNEELVYDIDAFFSKIN